MKPLKAVRQVTLDALAIDLGDTRRAAVLANIFGIVAHQAVTLASDAVLEFASSRDLEPLGSGFLGLHLRHFDLLSSVMSLWSGRSECTGMPFLARTTRKALLMAERGRGIKDVLRR